MSDKEKKKEQGYGKYILIEKLKNKFAGSFLSDRDSDNILVSTSMLLEGIHFSLVYFPLKHLGYKSVISSVSGIYSKGGKPETISVNIGIGNRFNYDDIETLVEGIEIACQNYELKMSGLNIDSSLTGLTISVTASGIPDPRLKSETLAAETDIVCVTGDLGAAFMGVKLLERERKVFEETGSTQPQLEGMEYVIGRQLKPELDTDIISKLSEYELKPTSVKIISEGLASDLIALARKNRMGCRLYHNKVPYARETADAGKEFNIEALIAALSGGDDYEFLFTFSVQDFDKVNDLDDLILVGHFTPEDEAYTLSLQDNSLAELKAQGWEEGTDDI